MIQPESFLSSLSLKLQPSPLPPNGGEYITEMEQLDIITGVISEYDPTNTESGIIHTTDTFKFVLYRTLSEINNDDSLESICIYKSPISWHSAFMSSIPCIKRIDKRITKDSVRVVPNKVDIFKAFELCPLENVKVVIMGQDPYYTIIDDEPVAMGCSFSTARHNGLPPSLKNIYIEIKRDYPDFNIPHHGDLTSWAKQGVLLLNASLTTIHNTPNAHAGLWDPFIFQIIRLIASKNKEIVFLLWGRSSQSLISSIISSAKHHFLKASHPSPMAYNKGRTPFEGCGHFKETNMILSKIGKPEINWNTLIASNLMI